MSIKIGIIGANGKMGQAIQEQINLHNNEYELTSIITSQEKNITQQDVWLDFSARINWKENLQLAEQTNTPIIIGTTGKDEIIINNPNIPILIAPNTSFTIAYIKQLLYKINTWNAVIGDTHHHTKKDTPSGTSLNFKEILTNTQQIYSFKNNIQGTKIKLDLSCADEMLELTYTTMNRQPFAIGALKAAKWLIKQPKGIYHMENVILNHTCE